MNNIVELTMELIRHKSLSCNEIELVNYISNILSTNKIEHIVDYYNPNHYTSSKSELEKTANVYIEVGAGDETLILYSHIDVVNGLDFLFEPKIKNNKLFGRGTCDMKSSLAGLMYVLINDIKTLKKANKKIIFAFIADEETSATGIKKFVDWLKLKKLTKPKAILLEPTDNFNFIHTGGKGYIFLDIQGEMKDIISSFSNLKKNKQKILNKFPDLNDGFGKPSVELTKISTIDLDYEKKIVYGKASHASRPENGENSIEKALESYNNLIYMNSSDSEGPNSLPSKVEIIEAKSDINTDKLQTKAHIDIRTNLAASENDQLLEIVKKNINSNLKISIRDYGKAFYVEDKNLLDICINKQFFDIKEEIAIGGSDAPYLLDITPNVIAGFGPGELKLCHTDEENIDLDILNKTPQVIRKIIKNYLET